VGFPPILFLFCSFPCPVFSLSGRFDPPETFFCLTRFKNWHVLAAHHPAPPPFVFFVLSAPCCYRFIGAADCLFLGGSLALAVVTLFALWMFVPWPGRHDADLRPFPALFGKGIFATPPAQVNGGLIHVRGSVPFPSLAPRSCRSTDESNYRIGAPPPTSQQEVLPGTSPRSFPFSTFQSQTNPTVFLPPLLSWAEPFHPP